MLEKLPEGFEFKMKFTLSSPQSESGGYLNVDDCGACVVSEGEKRVFIAYYYNGLYILCSNEGVPLKVKSPVEVDGIGSVNKILLSANENNKYSFFNFYSADGGDSLFWQKDANSDVNYLVETGVKGVDGQQITVLESKEKRQSQNFKKTELTFCAVVNSFFFNSPDESKPGALDTSYVAFQNNTIFSGNDLPGINFDHAILKYARFEGAKLQGASFINTQCNYSDFRSSDLSDAQFENVNLQSCKFDKRTVFSGTLFKNSQLYSMKLKGINFKKADFIDTSFSQSQLQGVNFSKANFKNALFLGADLTNSDFSNATLEDVDFTLEMTLAPSTIHWKGAIFKNCNFKKVSLKNVDFTGCYFENCNFKKANLKSTNFEKATVFGCDFTECDLTKLVIGDGENKLRFYDGSLDEYNDESSKTILNGATFEYTLIGQDWSLIDFRGAKWVDKIPQDLNGLKAACSIFDDGLDLSGRAIENANFRYSEMIAVDLRNSKSTGEVGPDFSNADLSRCNFHGALLKSALFELAKLEVGILSYANFGYSDFTGAILGGNSEERSADFQNAVLENVNFRGAFLVGVNFASCTLTGSNLEEAIIYLANFDSAYLLGANFSNIKDGLCQGVNFSGACLVNANFEGTTATNYKGDPTIFNKACLQGANFEDANLIGADLEDAGVDFESGEFLVVVVYPEDQGRPDREEYIPYDGTIINANKTNEQTICPDSSAGACTQPSQYQSENAPTSFTRYKV